MFFYCENGISLTILFVCGFLMSPISSCRLDKPILKQTGSQMIITCRVSCHSPLHRVRLSCPYSDHGFCTENCEVLIPNVMRCATERTDDSVSFTYKVEKANLTRSGKWSCGYGKEVSTAIDYFHAPTRAPPTTIPIPTTTTVSTTVFQDIPTNAPIIRRKETPANEKPKPSNNQNTNVNKAEENQSEEKEPRLPNGNSNAKSSNSIGDLFQINQPEIIFILLGILVVSLLFNVIFIIRCALTKSYIDGLRVGDPDMACLECCLCFTEDPYRKLQRRAPNGFLRGDQVYEDLPGSSVGENSNFYLNNPSFTPRLSTASTQQQVTESMIDPNTGMLMMPMTKMNSLMNNTHSNGGTFPRHHSHQHHVYPMPNGAMPPNNGGYVMVPRRGSIVGGSSNPYVLMSMANAQETASQTSQHSANSMQTLMARPNSAQIIFCEDGTPAIVPSVDMQRSSHGSNNAPIYGYSVSSQAKRFQQGTNTTHTNSVSGDGDTESTVSNATQNTNSNSNQVVNKGLAMEETNPENRQQSFDDPSQANTLYIPAMREQSPPSAEKLEVNVAQPILYNDNDNVTVTVPQSSGGLTNGGVHMMPALINSRAATATPPLPPYPAMPLEENNTAYTTNDMIQNWTKSNNQSNPNESD